MTHVVMVVPNDVTVDSRVQKSARSLQDAGYLVTVVGAQNKSSRSSDVLHGVLTLRVPRVPQLPSTQGARRARSVERRAAGLPAPLRWTARSGARVVRWWARRAEERWPMPVRAVPGQAHRREAVEFSQRDRDVQEWTARFAQTMIDLDPDVLYVHDAPLLLAGGVARDVLRDRGKDVPLIVDVHEWWPGVADVPADRIASRTDLEDRWIPRADAVVTVSPTLARWLRGRHHLPVDPWVVENGTGSGAGTRLLTRDLRHDCGLTGDVPLIVYAGAIAPARGLDIVVRALVDAPSVHLAIVAGARSPLVEQLEAQARELGVAERLHVVPFVEPDQVSAYLATADAGIAPFRRSVSHDSALATKISEYLGARLPLVVSDCEAQAEFVRRCGVGEVFVADDARAAAAAITRVIEGREMYRGAITPEVVRERTWEHQAQELLKAVGSVANAGGSGAGVPAPGPHVLPDARRALQFHAAARGHDASRAEWTGIFSSDSVAREALRRHRDALAGVDTP